MKSPVCCRAALFLTAGVRAGTVIYTDSTHPVTGNSGPDVTVILLDAPDQLQAQLFGPLTADCKIASKSITNSYRNRS